MPNGIIPDRKACFINFYLKYENQTTLLHTQKITALFWGRKYVKF